MAHISFIQFLESRNQLYEAYDRTPVTTNSYNMTKYCKIPVELNEVDTEYISLKPDDIIIIEWEYHDYNKPTANKITVNEECYKPIWNNKKMCSWVKSSAKEKKRAQ